MLIFAYELYQVVPYQASLLVWFPWARNKVSSEKQW